LPVTAIRADDADNALAVGASEMTSIPYTDLGGCRILVVDDEHDARTLIERILAQCNATVITAASAAEGIEAVRRHRPHLVVSDIGMPGEDGYEFLAKLRQLSDAEGGDTPAVALTAFARSEDRRRALMAGFQMYLPKPVESAELLAVASNLFTASRRGKANVPGRPNSLPER
jgi:CheY-like chemotaxis protein